MLLAAPPPPAVHLGEGGEMGPSSPGPTVVRAPTHHASDLPSNLEGYGLLVWQRVHKLDRHIAQRVRERERSVRRRGGLCDQGKRGSHLDHTLRDQVGGCWVGGFGSELCVSTVWGLVESAGRTDDGAAGLCSDRRAKSQPLNSRAHPTERSAASHSGAPALPLSAKIGLASGVVL